MKKIPIFILLAIGLYIVLFLLYFLVPIIVSLCSGAWEYYKQDDIQYQLKMLEHGTTAKRIEAMSSLSDNNQISIIPILMQNIDNFERASWRKEPKGGLQPVSCVATSELRSLTKNSLKTTCYYDTENEEDEKRIIQEWRDWYKNEYPAWLEEQKQISG